MKQSSIGPYRQKLLKIYIACLGRAERRVKIAGSIAGGNAVDLERFRKQRPLIEHAAACIKSRGVVGHASALMCLQIVRSKLQAELENLKW